MTTPRAPNGELRLLYLINSLGPGGAERSLAELAPHYVAAGVRPVVVCLRPKRHNAAVLRRSGCDLRFLDHEGTPARLRTLRRVIVREDIHLVHTTLFEADLAGRLAAAGTGVPVLTSLVNTTYDPVRLADPRVSRRGLRATRLVDGVTARRLTTGFHAITEAVKRDAVAALGIRPASVTVVERGRDPDRLGRPGAARRARSRRRLGLPPDAEVVVNVGRHEYQKGQRHLLEAAGLLAMDRPGLVVLVVGREGHATPELHALRGRLHLEERVRFLGLRGDVPEVLAAADLFAFPSLYEGLGGAVIEAMALGLPVVASDIPALREVVEDGGTGRLVPRSSPRALAAAIGGLLDDPAAARLLGARGREVFEARFTIQRSARRMVALYRRLAGGVAHAATPVHPVPSS